MNEMTDKEKEEYYRQYDEFMASLTKEDDHKPRNWSLIFITVMFAVVLLLCFAGTLILINIIGG